MTSDFPILNKKGRQLIYLDSAATSLKPKQVIDAVVSFYREYSANVHRGIYQESEKATQNYEAARGKVAKFINVSKEEIIFTKNTTEAINLVANAWGEKYIKKGSKIVSSIMEHHSNLLPWQELVKKKKANMVFLDIDSERQLDLSQLEKMLKGAVLLAVTQVSNVLGTINPVKMMVRAAYKAGAKVFIDGAQAVGHMPVDVTDLGCDFYAFSGHKCLGPSGTGVLWMKKEIARSLPPFLLGGGMVSKVTLGSTSYLEGPHKYEAGTPNIEGVIGLGAAVDYLKKLGMEKIQKKEQNLTEYCLRKLSEIPDLTIYGAKSAKVRSGIIAFNIAGFHPHDLASMLDLNGIAVRAGHHCAIPLHQRLGINGSVRISLHVYNNRQDIDKLVNSLIKIRQLLRG